MAVAIDFLDLAQKRVRSRRYCEVSPPYNGRSLEFPDSRMVGGTKGGVEKSVVTLALVDHLRCTGVDVVLVETDMPEHIRQAGTGRDAVGTEARAATDALMAQHRHELARCKATIELAEQMTGEHETRYRAALAALNDEALVALTQRAVDHIARIVGNRLVGTTRISR